MFSYLKFLLYSEKISIAYLSDRDLIERKNNIKTIKEVVKMSMKLVNIRMDEDLKKEMEIVCNDLGINITTAFTIFAKKLTREKRIPFSVSIDPFYSNENIKALENSINEVKDGKVIMKTIEELEAME